MSRMIHRHLETREGEWSVAVIESIWERDTDKDIIELLGTYAKSPSDQRLKLFKKPFPILRSTVTLPCSELSWSGGVRKKVTDWERLLRVAAEIQQIIPKAVLVGGTAAAIHSKHRFSFDANHVLPDLEENFDALLDLIESNRDWHTQRVQPPKLILGRFKGVETGLRQLVRKKPLETIEIILEQKRIVVPTAEEMLRI